MPSTPTRILRLQEVLDRVGLSKSAVYDAMSRNAFPHSVALLGGRSRGWVEAEIEAFLQEQIVTSRAA